MKTRFEPSESELMNEVNNPSGGTIKLKRRRYVAFFYLKQVRGMKTRFEPGLPQNMFTEKIIQKNNSIIFYLMENSIALMLISSNKFDKNSHTLHIADCRLLLCVEHNKGYGSIGLQMFLDFCLQNEFFEITGDIAEIDWHEVKKLKHFYKKAGFTVILNHDKKTGSISKKLK